MTREECIDIYKRYSRKLFNVSLRIVGDSGEAEEIMQDTVLKFFQQEMAGQARHEGRGMAFIENERLVGAWMVRTCVRASIDAVRRRKRERLFFEEYEAAGKEEYPEAAEEGRKEYVAEEEVGKIKDAIRELPDSYRIILTLVLIEGLDYEEISGMTGTSEGTLRTQYSRARKMLAARLKEMKVIEYD
ncbi:MAG: RNA polymerase sigma factor [Bacteroidales bacterium]|nr:RNA polymerase sigma factor [Bacteroidales bacterium]